MLRIVVHKWSDEADDFVPCPLDDADWWTIEIVRRFTGSNVSAEQVRELLEEAPVKRS